MVLTRLALLLGMAMCGSSPETAPRVAPATGCLPSTEPADLVVQVVRSTLPIGNDRTEERGAMTTGGTCPTNVACRTLERAAMTRIWTALVDAATIDHGPPASPHYGGRWLQATWTGGSCELADSSQTPVAPASEARFDAAFDAVVAAFN